MHLTVARALVCDRLAALFADRIDGTARAPTRLSTTVVPSTSIRAPVQALDAAPGGRQWNPVLRLHRDARLPGNRAAFRNPVRERGVLAREKVRNEMAIGSAVLSHGRSVALFRVHAERRIERVGRRVNVRLVLIDRIVDDGDDGEDIVVPRDELRHGVHVGGLRSAASEVAVFQMCGRDLQCVADPLTGGKPVQLCGAYAGGCGRPSMKIGRSSDRMNCTW